MPAYGWRSLGEVEYELEDPPPTKEEREEKEKEEKEKKEKEEAEKKKLVRYVPVDQNTAFYKVCRRLEAQPTLRALSISDQTFMMRRILLTTPLNRVMTRETPQ